jgi:predicted nucleic acid-binding protein
VRAVLVDTDILIEVSRGRNGAVVAAWRALAVETETLLALTPVTVAELWRGVREPERAALAELTRTMLCVDLDRQAGERAGEYMRRFGPSHAVELADALLAAVAVEHGMLLWTRNRRHYPMPEIRFFSS